MIARYLVITPAKDEERFLPGLIRSLTAQRVLPSRWIIADDNSSDGTPEIIDAAAAKYPWIEARHMSRKGPRKRGGASVAVSNLQSSEWHEQDFILCLDADLSFGPRFVESLLVEFERDPQLGIAGGTLLERHGRELRAQRLPRFHVRGATKMYSRACFEAIGGITPCPAWDTIDEVRAMMLGFRTRNFTHIQAIHHRPLGGADGSWRVIMAAGEAAYDVGYAPLFMLARAVYRAWTSPRLLGGLLLMWGYLRPYIRREPRTAEPELVRFVRREQHRRLLLMESRWQ
jgi:glycosyltransferase involved in cell wall biosynthesis